MRRHFKYQNLWLGQIKVATAKKLWHNNKKMTSSVALTLLHYKFTKNNPETPMDSYLNEN